MRFSNLGPTKQGPGHGHDQSLGSRVMGINWLKQVEVPPWNPLNFVPYLCSHYKDSGDLC